MCNEEVRSCSERLTLHGCRERRMGIGAPLGEEAVLADSERVGEVAAGVGRVRRATFSKHPARSLSDVAFQR